MPKPATINIIVCRVGRLPTLEQITNDDNDRLSAMQKIVGGRVDCIGMADGLDAWVNDEWRVLDLPLNRIVAVDAPLAGSGYAVDIGGDFLIARVTPNGDTAGVTDDDFQAFLKMWDAEDVEAAQQMNELRAKLGWSS